MVYDRYRTAPWPVDPVPAVGPGTGGIGITWPRITLTGSTVDPLTALDAFEELCAAAKKLDAILGLPDCEDPTKAEWLTKVKEQVRQHELEKLEKRLNK